MSYFCFIFFQFNTKIMNLLNRIKTIYLKFNYIYKNIHNINYNKYHKNNNLSQKSIQFINIITLTIFISGLYSCNQKAKDKMINAPIAKKIPKELIKHDNIRIDNYYWLNQKENPDVIKYLEDENEYTQKSMEHTTDLQKTLFEEIKSRIKKNDISVPFKDNGYYYYSRFEEGKEYPTYCRKKENLKNTEEILLDLNIMAEGLDYFNLGDYSVSTNNSIISYSIDTVSRREYTIQFMDLLTKEVYKEKIEKTSGEIIWANDNKTIFYSKKDPVTLRDYQIYKHTLGQDPANDVLVYQEEDEMFSVGVSKTKSEKYILIGTFSTLSSEFRFLDADKPNGKFKIFQPRTKNMEYNIEHYNDKFYIVTNHYAKNFKLMTSNLINTGINNWTELIAHRDNVFLEDIEIFRDFLVVEERKNGLVQIRVINQKNKAEHYLDFGEPVYSVSSGTNLDFDSELLRFGYTSLTSPNSIYDYNMNTKERVLLKEEEVVGGYDKSDYISERIYVKSRDGVKIPVSIVYKKGIKKDGSNPAIQYGYGSYGVNMDVYFSTARLSLLDRGFVYVIAHIRGGQELGRDWYENGKFLKKKNTFNDFIDVSKFLIEKKYTNKDKLFAMGGSAGGLLMGAVINIAPELYKGIVASVPFVDVVTTMLDETIPLTTGEYEEWGNPNDKLYYDYMLTYSPYDNVKKQNYPNMLVTTGLHDSQVQYWEPAKWVAKLRDYKTDKNKLFLFTQMKAGHGGKSGRFERIKEIALQYAFILDLAGIDK